MSIKILMDAMVSGDKVWSVYISDNPAFDSSINESVFFISEIKVLKIFRSDHGFGAIVSDYQGCTYTYSDKEINLVYYTKEDAKEALAGILSKRIQKMKEDAGAYVRSLDALLTGSGKRIKTNPDDTYVMCI